MIAASIVAAMLLAQRDRITLRRLWFPPGWLLAALLASTWPLLMVRGTAEPCLSGRCDRHRLSSGPKGNGPFASEPWWGVPSLLAQALTWTPLAIAGSYDRCRIRAAAASHRSLAVSLEIHSFRTFVVTGDRLLWVWAVAPLGLLALATVKNAHLRDPGTNPLVDLGGLALARVRRMAAAAGVESHSVASPPGAGLPDWQRSTGWASRLLAPWFDRQRVEWAFPESAGH